MTSGEQSSVVPKYYTFTPYTVHSVYEISTKKTRNYKINTIIPVYTSIVQKFPNFGELFKKELTPNSMP